MKIYTRKGDQGTTSLFGGERVSKDHMRLHAYGTIDELNACIGLAIDHIHAEEIRQKLANIQEYLFSLGSYLATPQPEKVKLPALDSHKTTWLEEEMDKMDNELEPLRNFILPGGHVSISQLHICRTVCRRAERWVTGVADTEKIDPLIAEYLNRLSDYLFVLARYQAQLLDIQEINWNPSKH
jgi:cob(I)alamin adenosyltransferase